MTRACAPAPAVPARPGLQVVEWKPLRFVAGVTYVVVGTAFLLDSLRVWRVRAVDVWPLALIAVGTWVLLGRVKRVRVEEDRSSQLAVAEERVRIARELHDIVAHSVSLMTVQIAAARRVQHNQPEAAERALAAAEETGRQSLAELRGMLSTLRGADASIAAASPGRAAGGSGWPGGSGGTGAPGAGTPGAGAAADGRAPLPGLADLENLVAGARDAGLDVRLSLSGDPPRAPASVGLAVYRVVQEALTNAVRHSGASHVDVEVTYAPNFVILFVDDDGEGGNATGTTRPGASRPGEGHGILGMRERVWAVGGTLETGPRTPGPGWRVHARIPVMELPQ